MPPTLWELQFLISSFWDGYQGVFPKVNCFVNYPILQVMEFLLESSLVELI